MLGPSNVGRDSPVKNLRWSWFIYLGACLGRRFGGQLLGPTGVGREFPFANLGKVLGYLLTSILGEVGITVGVLPKGIGTFWFPH